MIEKDKTGTYIQLFIDIGERYNDGILQIASEMISEFYGQKTNDVDEARLKKLLAMNGKINQVGIISIPFYAFSFQRVI
jgi:hypothetical protein